MHRTVLSYKSRPAFTIVELLIVVVVIAILAAITIVSYNGITNSAKEATLKSDLSTAAKKLHVAKVEDGSFPSSTPDYISDGLTYSGGGSSFCVSGTANGRDFRIKESGSVEEGDCTAPVATTMQSFTGAQCSALATFTGSNSEAVIQLTDSRGDTTRTYEVAKLADGNCWMLNNLKLGSTTATTQLTNQDTNLNNKTSFTLPQILTTGPWDTSTNPGNNYDTPYAYGPVPGDTGSGATNYGYLYNWSATTAGESRTSHPRTAGNAPNDICPKGWRLPTGSTGGDFPNLDIAFGGTGVPASSGPSLPNWQNNGPFKGVFSGSRVINFNSQDSFGSLWSSSAAYPSSDSVAFGANFNATNVNPGHVDYFRANGLGVRCLLN